MIFRDFTSASLITYFPGSMSLPTSPGEVCRMPFMLQESWDVPQFSSGTLRDYLSGEEQESHGASRRKVYRAGGAIFTILVHTFALWLLATRPAPAPGVIKPEQPQPKRELILVSLNDAAPSPPAEKQLAQPPPQQPQEASPVDSTALSQMPPVEWTVSRASFLDTPTATAVPAAASAASMASSGSGGGGVYDPFAGAAPLRSAADAPRNVAPVSSLQVLEPTLDVQLLERIRRQVAAAHAGSTGSAQVVVRVSSDGTVLEASMIGGNAPQGLKRHLIHALKGTRLFTSAAGHPRDLTLPLLSFHHGK
jgi:hypothetical protein